MKQWADTFLCLKIKFNSFFNNKIYYLLYKKDIILFTVDRVQSHNHNIKGELQWHFNSIFPIITDYEG